MRLNPLGGWLILLFMLGNRYACAADFPAQVQQFFQQRHAADAYQVVSRIKTPRAQWPPCEQPRFESPGGARRWGNLSLPVSCAGRRSFIQVQVEVTGHYWVAARSLSSGIRLTEADLRSKKGRLDLLPARTLLSSRQVLGAVTLRHINPGQPLTQAMIRRAWVVRAGQEVAVIAQGDGFTVRSGGKAVSNAVLAENVRIRMSSGQIVTGVAQADGSIHLPMPH